MNGKQKLWKTAGRIFLFLCILWLVFHKHYREIYENICNANMGTVVLISCMGLSYQIIWGAALYVLMRKRNPQITIRNAIENVYLGFFLPNNLSCINGAIRPPKLDPPPAQPTMTSGYSSYNSIAVLLSNPMIDWCSTT